MERMNAWAEEYLRVVDRMWEEGELSEGRMVLESILREEPDYAKAHGYAGWYAQYHQKNRGRAEMHYELALKFDPSYDHVYIQYAEFLIEDRNLERMTRLKNEGLKYPSVDRAMLLNNYGRALEIHEKYQEAVAAYKEAMRYTMNDWVMNNIRNNRRRARAKYHLFAAIYSSFV